MANGRVWAIKGISDRTREAVLEVAHATGLSVGEWVDQALSKAAAEARSPNPTAATREDVAAVMREVLGEQLSPIVDRVASLTEQLERLGDRLTAFDERISRQAEPDLLSGATAGKPSPIEAMRARARRRREM
jgi:hypothetical protein